MAADPNAQTYSSLSDIRIPAALTLMWMLLTADRSPLVAHPSLRYIGRVNRKGSNALKQGWVGLGGYDQMAEVAEGVDLPITALTDASDTVTVARVGKAYESTDLARITDPYALLDDPMPWVLDAQIARDIKLTSLIAALTSGFSNSTATSGTDLSVATWLDAITALEIRSVPGPYLGILHPRQYADLRSSLRSETGPLQLVTDSQNAMQIQAAGAKSPILIDTFSSPQVPTANAGADRSGMILGRSAILWGDAALNPDPLSANIQIAFGRFGSGSDGDQPSESEGPAGGPVLIEWIRDGLGGVRQVAQHAYMGVAEGEDTAGQSVVTDA